MSFNSLKHMFGNSRKWFKYSVVFCVMIHFIYLISLPLYISPDGFDYIRLANLFFTDKMYVDWNYLRTPLFPLMLRLYGSVVGFNAFTHISFLTLLGLFSALSLGYLVKEKSGAGVGAVIVFVLSLNPVLIAFEHSLLMETLLCFSFCLFLVLLNLKIKNIFYHSLLMGIYVGILYYIKPNLLVFVLPAGLFLSYVFWIRTNEKLLKKITQLIFVNLIVVLIPIIIASPWAKKASGKNDAAKRGFLLAGLLIQGVFPKDSEMLGKKKTEYEEALNRFSKTGKLEIQGIIGDPNFYGILDQLFIITPNPGLDFVSVVRANPSAYFHGLLNNIKLMLEFDHPYNETVNFGLMLFHSHKNLISDIRDDRVLYDYVQERYSFSGGVNRVQRVLTHSVDLYRILLRMGWFFTVLVFLLGLWKKNPFLLSVSFVPLFWASVNLVLLLSSARYFFPVSLIVISNSFIFLFYMYSLLKKNERLRFPF
ncbi:hypothetical protein LPTSP3_g21130 [Leptospira kobayashii]|uniref:Glycosyltransferase RgtA/B/C/D-like domain-containing protein n=1 Tax=Leptospira kobayashii TaxID=1917830 RepID=A0ABM7UJX8_9LEPT|nr:hypothetical protein [Leptospira kobayashii]BDA79183.1 hypothetical protein LPTSP3_g21130 [Leptospira kobayashii]